MVALKSTVSPRRPYPRKAQFPLKVVRSGKSEKPARYDPTSSKDRTRVPPVTSDESSIASQQRTPSWLRTLIGLERCVTVVTIALGAATLTVYGLTVYSQQQWSRNYERLHHLQRHERQLRVANELLKNEMASQAENPDRGLVPQNPNNTIFLPPAPEGNSSGISPVPRTSNLTTPLGY